MESHPSGYLVMDWGTGGIVVVQMAVHSTPATMAEGWHFGHGGGWFVHLLLAVVSGE